MADDIWTWAKDRRCALEASLKGLRAGILTTTELRDGKRVNTTTETIAERKRELAQLVSLITQNETNSA